MFAIVSETRMPLWRKVLMGLCGMALAGCAPHGAGYGCCGPTIVYATPVPVVAGPEVQACADHAAAGLRAQGTDFKYLKLETLGMFEGDFRQFVGDTHVETVRDGYGEVFGRGQWARVRVHCLSDRAGQVLYSFVRAE